MALSHLSAGAERPARPRAGGFTLVEVLVALVILSLIAALAWQGVDSMVKSRDIAQGRLGATLRLQTVMAQIEADVGALVDTQAVEALRFDGAALRLTRRSGDGVQLVVWALRSGVWQRWASPPVTRLGELREAWMRSLQLLGNEPGTLRALEGVEGWQVYFSRNGAWTNAQSSGDVVTPGGAAVPAPGLSGAAGGMSRGTPEGEAASAPGGAAAPRITLPQGIRVVLSFAPGSGQTGSLTRDLVVAPTPAQQ